MLLVPLSAVAAAMAADLYLDRQAWALWVVALLPPLLALHALWQRPRAPLTAAIMVLSLAPIGLGIYGMLPDPARDARLKAQQEEAANQAREAREREASDFAALGPESSLADYLPYLHGAYGDRALAGIQKVKSRQSDAVALLAEAPLADLADLWQFNLVPTRELCAAYGQCAERRRQPDHEGAERLHQRRDRDRMAAAQPEVADCCQLRSERSARTRRGQHPRRGGLAAADQLRRHAGRHPREDQTVIRSVARQGGYSSRVPLIIGTQRPPI